MANESKRTPWLSILNSVCTVIATVAAAASAALALQAVAESRQTQLTERRLAACLEVDQVTMQFMQARFDTGLDWSSFMGGYYPPNEWPCEGAQDTECHASNEQARRVREARLSEINRLRREGSAKFRLLGPTQLADAEEALNAALDVAESEITDETFSQLQSSLRGFRSTCAEVIGGYQQIRWLGFQSMTTIEQNR